MAGGVNIPVGSTWNPKGLTAAQRDLQRFHSQIKGVAAGIGVTLGLRALVGQIGATVDAASNLNESMSKSRTVFGQSAAAIEDWSKTSSTALLMSQQQALEAAGTYGNLFQAFGLGQQQAAEMSKTLVQLAADLASFNNTSVQDAIEALRSGLSGETEPLKRYGVALTDARMRQEALNLGIYDGKGVLDASQKAQAAYALALKDTKLAQGDVARTATGYANTMRAVEAAVENAKASIGGGFLLAIQDAAEAMGGPGGLAKSIENAGAAAGDFIVGMELGLRDLIEKAQRLGDVLPGGDDSANIFDAYRIIPGVQAFIATTENASAAGEEHRLELEAQAAEAESLQRHYSALTSATSAYAAAADRTSTQTDEASAAQQKFRDKIAATKATVESLQQSLDRLYGVNRSKVEDRIALKRMRSDGPAQSGSYTTGKGKNKETVNFSTADDARLWAVDYARAAGEYADNFKSKGKQAQILQNAQAYIASQVGQYGVGKPGQFASSIIGAPPSVTNPRPWEGMYDRSGSQYNITVTVPPGATLDQIIKEGEKLAASSGGRFVQSNGGRYGRGGAR